MFLLRIGENTHTFQNKTKTVTKTAQITFELIDIFLPLGDFSLWKVKWPGDDVNI